MKDPDAVSNYDVEVEENLRITLSQDGLCSFERIKEFSKNIIEDYELLRKDMFDCLYWPAYAMSINQMRSSKYKDRLDLLFVDINRFYGIVSENTVLSIDVIKEIWENCELARAYVYPNTFYWLRSFTNFEGFITKGNRDLSVFLVKENNKCIPDVWPKTGEGFTQEYYDQLIDRVKSYKKNSILYA